VELQVASSDKFGHHDDCLLQQASWNGVKAYIEQCKFVFISDTGQLILKYIYILYSLEVIYTLKAWLKKLNFFKNIYFSLKNTLFSCKIRWVELAGLSYI
jgi:hypothetical protein